MICNHYKKKVVKNCRRTIEKGRNGTNDGSEGASGKRVETRAENVRNDDGAAHGVKRKAAENAGK